MGNEEEITQAKEALGDAAKSEQPEFCEATFATVRRRLPDVRQSVTHKFSVCGTEGYIIAGLFDDGSVGEVFLKIAKQGSTLGGLANTIGVLTSLCLQNGVRIEAIADKLVGMQFEPRGHTSNPDIRFVTSLTSYVFEWLRMNFGETPKLPYQEPESDE